MSVPYRCCFAPGNNIKEMLLQHLQNGKPVVEPKQANLMEKRNGCSRSSNNTHTHTHNRFTALWILSGTTRVSWYQKKHSPTHTHHGQQIQ